MKQCPFGINCDDCKFFRPWNMKNGLGQEAIQTKCGFDVVFDEIILIKGAIDGLQGGVNEARNRSMETKESVEVRTTQFVETLKTIAELGGGGNVRINGSGRTHRNQIGEG